MGFKLNKDKIHVVYNYHKQTVTGIVVNKKLGVSSTYKNKIRQEIYFIKKYGLTSHLQKLCLNIDEKTYLNKLLGKVLYVLQINNDNKFKEYKEYLENLKKG